ncbi:zinc transporter ZIP1 isoform X3 [Eurytemora carolleeae]|uniref:zinc transporter ZIP1 isoform X3 n=1 Tax=Eurytemora carolleeae TaxID=1294199 RepID=UPI000C7667A4|nr:zinc transporter ZIP1 isoform X3 [Eurytemora carolleeae]|eukprot:XP_023322722.1 zinc transporter ZIP1-like isoform X3 [Eurytemora affinis]
MDTSTILEEMEYTTIDDVEKMGAKALISEKIIVMVSMFAVTFLFGLIPLKLFSAVRENTDVTSRIRWKNVLSFASCFAGGVFIAACLLDLVPDVEEKINEVLEEIKDSYGVDVEYPLAQFIIVMGFFLILTVEQTVLYFQESWMSEAERQPLLSRSRQTSVNQNDFESISRQDSITGLSNVGLAIGLQDDSASLISIFVAVIVHKAVMAFSLGLNIAQSVMSVKNFIISNFIFSISSPIGLAVGIGIADLPSSLPQNIANGILQGIAGGTFLYITFFEVLPHELNVPTNRLWKVLFVLLGFALICGLLFITH